jgi:hypothetical protein
MKAMLQDDDFEICFFIVRSSRGFGGLQVLKTFKKSIVA